MTEPLNLTFPKADAIIEQLTTRIHDLIGTDYRDAAVDAADRAEAAADRLGSAETVEGWVASAEASAETASGAAATATSAVRAEVDKLIAGAPEAFDTLKEISDELEKNETERAALATTIGKKADTAYVDKEIDYVKDNADGQGASVIPFNAATGRQRWADGLIEVVDEEAPTGRYYTNEGDWKQGRNYFFQVDPDMTYYVSMWVKADKPGSRMYIELRDQSGRHAVQSGNLNNAGTYILGNYELPTEWTLLESRSLRFRDGVSRANINSLYFNHANGSEREAVQMLTDIQFIPLAPHTHDPADIGDARGMTTASNGEAQSRHIMQLDVDGHFSQGVNPTRNNHLTRKGYVDTEVGKKADTGHTHDTADIRDYPGHAVWVGSTAYGKIPVRESDSSNLRVGNTPEQDYHAASKGYVDSQDATKADTEHKHTSADITDTVYRAGTSDTANKVIAASGSGRLYYDRAPGTTDEIVNREYVDTEVGKKADTTYVDQELDERVPPLVAESIATDRAVADAAAIATAEKAQEAIDSSNNLVYSERAREIPRGTDWDTLLDPGPWSRKYSTGTPDPNQPTSSVGELVVGESKNPTGMQTQTYTASSGGGVFYRSRGSNGRWTDWVRLDPNEAILDKSTARREVLVEDGLTRRGRVIGTGGLPVVALRFDHHLQQFEDKVLPILKRLRLPWGQMLCPGTMGTSNDTWTWEKTATECHQSGGEVWNHSWSHLNVTSKEDADREITRSMRTLKQSLPSLWIDGWAPPGQSVYMGYEGQNTSEKHWDTYPGQLIMAQHAFVRGYYPAVYRKLNGPELVGVPHTTIDKMDSKGIGGMVRGAMYTGSGVTLMLHSNYLDSDGYLSTAELTTALEYIASLRDSGQLMVLSPTAIMMADRDLPRTTGNITTNGIAGAITGSWSETLWSREANQHYGVPHEAEVWVKGSGEATLTVDVASATYPVTVTHSVTLGQSAQRLSVAVTPPMDTTATTITLTANGKHTGVRYRPI